MAPIQFGVLNVSLSTRGLRDAPGCAQFFFEAIPRGDG